MSSAFQTIGLIGKPNHEGANQTLVALYRFLLARGLTVYLEQKVARTLALDEASTLDLADIGKHCDLAIVVGGDGNMLGAARVLARSDIAVIGVNRGNLGFLTDLSPEGFEQPLTEVLAGNYQTELRNLLEISVYRDGSIKSSNSAVNEAVLHADKVAHMIEFEAYINQQFVFSQRSDGLIVSTPTGSTAYSLSGGGPILTPDMDAISLVPMFPHTLSSRPLVVSGSSEIQLKLADSNDAHLQISCDSHVILAVMPGDDIFIRKHPRPLRLIHPPGYSYYHVLRNKLGWGSRLY
ncbi:NAD(+) kinase [Alkalimonas delamerensis]|uniref:NAD kinase n=1 Tax=Alkalimonas delamerensis TaxID=265981 RepID=A0ABT9GT34_9GAMM|nr:NAD(+) kinase [Alkalimonas delamerensis]MDP4529796.1 NAD(+) kinase [Alkalimonas delamerensis]